MINDTVVIDKYNPTDLSKTICKRCLKNIWTEQHEKDWNEKLLLCPHKDCKYTLEHTVAENINTVNKYSIRYEDGRYAIVFHKFRSCDGTCYKPIIKKTGIKIDKIPPLTDPLSDFLKIKFDKTPPLSDLFKTKHIVSKFPLFIDYE